MLACTDDADEDAFVIAVPPQRIVAIFMALAVMLGAPVADTLPWDMVGCSRAPAADEYTAVRYVDAELVDDLCIEWRMGNVVVRVADDKELDGQVVIAETAPEGWHDVPHMSIESKGGELVVRYGGLDSSTTTTHNVSARKKSLKVTLPKSCAERLDTVTLSGSPGTYTLLGISCKTLNVRFEAGTLLAKDVATRDLVCTVSSGHIGFDGTVSSSIDVCVSSGNARVRTDTTPDKVDLEASSGSIDLLLPKDAGFTARAKVGAGSFVCDFNATERDGKLVVGDGEMPLNVDVSSGTVHIGKR